MVSFKSLLALSSAAMTVMDRPVSQCEIEHLTITNNSIGPICDLDYVLLTSTETGAELNVEPGQYNLTWNTDSGLFVVGGLGWSDTETSRIINYNGSYTSSGNGSLSVYGVIVDPLVEYYIVESYDTYNPSTGATHLGTVTSDGGTYDVYHTLFYDDPSSNFTWNQWWSVRQSHRTSGSINVANHFNAWESYGVTWGPQGSQFFATMGYQNSGSSSFTVSSGDL